MKAANPLYVPTDISRAPKPRTDRPARQQITEEPKEATDNVVVRRSVARGAIAAATGSRDGSFFRVLR